MRLSIVLLAIMLHLAPAAARAQVVVGDTVRVFDAQGVLAEGILLRADSTALRLVQPDGAAAVLPLAVLSRAEVRRGTRALGGRAVAVGAGIGTVLGATMGALLAGSAQSSEGGSLAVILLGALGMLGGGAAGGVAAVSETANWVAFDVRTLATSVR